MIDDIRFEAVHQGEQSDSFGWQHHLYRVTLIYDGRTFSTEYRMGMGCVDYKPITHQAATTRRNRGQDVRWNHFGPGKDALATPRAPTLKDVLGSLASDCQLGDQLFEDFCGDLGYDVDSRKAHATWEACQQMHYELRSLFGHARYQEFIEHDWEGE
jgi:hypothetical protein